MTQDEKRQQKAMLLFKVPPVAVRVPFPHALTRARRYRLATGVGQILG